MDAVAGKKTPIKAQFKMITVGFKRARTNTEKEKPETTTTTETLWNEFYGIPLVITHTHKHPFIHSLAFARTTNKFRI